MTLDEAIKLYTDLVKINEAIAKERKDDRSMVKTLLKFAEEYQETAEWLKELKRYREHRMDDYE